MNHEVIEREFRGKDILSTRKFSREGFCQLFSFAQRMRPIAQRKVRTQVLGGYVMGSFFFKESTRTRLSSEAAFLRLGGGVITFIDPKFSSVIKGESFEDTICTVDSYCDLMTLRVEKEGQASLAAAIAEHPVINCGDGSGEHPTQGLLDGFTLKESAPMNIERQPFTIAVIGDSKYGRTVHSLVPMMTSLCDKLTFRFVAPDFLQIPDDLITFARDRGCRVDQTDKLLEGLQGANAAYVVRPQFERMPEPEQAMWRECEGRFRIDRRTIEEHCRSDILITHPMPRNAEIATDVDTMPNALYRKRQVENGEVIRMALCVFILGKEEKFV